MKKLNWYSCLGLLVLAISLISGQFGLLPHFIQGFFMGLGLTCIIAGLIAEMIGMDKLKCCKRNLVKRAFGR